MRLLALSGLEELIHDSDHLLFGNTVAVHHQPDQRVPQHAGELKSIVRSHDALRSLLKTSVADTLFFSGRLLIPPLLASSTERASVRMLV